MENKNKTISNSIEFSEFLKSTHFVKYKKYFLFTAILMVFSVLLGCIGLVGQFTNLSCWIYYNTIHQIYVDYNGILTSIASLIFGLILTLLIRDIDSEQAVKQEASIKLITENVQDLLKYQTTLVPIDGLKNRFIKINELLKLSIKNEDNTTYISSFSAIYGIVQCHNVNLVVNENVNYFKDKESYFNHFNDVLNEYKNMMKLLSELIYKSSDRVKYAILKDGKYEEFLQKSFEDKFIIPITEYSQMVGWDSTYFAPSKSIEQLYENMDLIYTMNMTDDVTNFKNYSQKGKVSEIKDEFITYFKQKNEEAKLMFDDSIIPVNYIPFQFFLSIPREDVLHSSINKMGIIIFPNPKNQGKTKGGTIAFETRDSKLIDSLAFTFKGFTEGAE